MKATQTFKATNEGMLYTIDVEIDGRLLRSDMLVTHHEQNLGGLPSHYIERSLRNQVMSVIRKELFPCES